MKNPAYTSLIDSINVSAAIHQINIDNEKLVEDDKVQVEWVVKYKGEYFTIYDWKTYDRNYTETKLDIFNIGGKTSAFDFIDAVEKLIK